MEIITTINDMEQYYYFTPTPVGSLLIIGTNKAINALSIRDNDKTDLPVLSKTELPDVFVQCVAEMDAYFAGSQKGFTFPIAQEGTPFQQSVWDRLLTIPYGQTTTYLKLAKDLNNPKAIRAVGSTNGRNQLWVVVPCHRVIGSNGTLTGYAGGIWRKKWLLEHETKHRFGSQGQLF
ncbi:methylated-DNA--[protein]-cysteine S-methyltransferase [[Flexibacter] sp. ATCC 35208]|uniref:methylated-DNA--[protein]-cysteine S-methyltransferase n=1 Tax=[Flexibacter] sp. ATCC 35208 TaxID=1936242 RepID=UPI001F3AEDA5|nr:methylated-DNA--[protein]-cysteine S-methyltransferase [[Flexibacter] sp. ATCC 35208]